MDAGLTGPTTAILYEMSTEAFVETADETVVLEVKKDGQTEVLVAGETEVYVEKAVIGDETNVEELAFYAAVVAVFGIIKIVAYVTEPVEETKEQIGEPLSDSFAGSSNAVSH